jgi:hypothetical protein
MLIDHMSKGLSYETFAVTIGVVTATIYTWEGEFAKFLEAKKSAFEHNRLFWERVGIQGTVGKIKGFNQTGWIFNMKNRFPKEWRDRHDDQETKTVQPILINLPISGESKKIESVDVKSIGEADE